MAITSPHNPPTTPGLAGSRLTARFLAGISESEFTFDSQVQLFDGDRWELELVLPAMNRPLAEPWLAWWIAMRAGTEHFLYGDPDDTGSAGAPGANVKVNGAGQAGTTLAVDDLPVSTAGVVKAGDYFQLGTGSSARLYKVLQDADSNGSGEASLDIFPKLRSVPADNAAVDFTDPVGVFRVLPGQPVTWQTDNIGIYRAVTIRAIEKLP